jgi:hypothetical protein
MSAQGDPSGNEFRGDQRVVIEETEEQVDPKAELVSDERRAELIDEGDIVAEVERERGENQSKRRGRKAVAGVVFLVVIAAGAIGAWYVIGRGGKRQARVPVNRSSKASAVESEEALTKQAIELTNSAGPGITLSDGSVIRPSMPSPSPMALNSDSNVPVTQLPMSNGELSSTVNSGKPPTAKETEEKREGDQARVSSGANGRNHERSVRISEDFKAQDLKAQPPNRTGDREASVGEVGKDAGGVAMPPFGSMLPVRTLGVLYTLRSGGLARFELTSDVKGKGWAMPRGTVLVGALRDAKFDRAFVSLVGFIDTESGRFVKISGDLLGSDGGAGIRGKRRKMSSGWSRALSKLGEAGLSIASSFAGSVGRRPIVINDAFGSYGGRLTSELDGVLVGGDRNSFVEVAAGSSGYMMITELPDSVEGVDALSRLSGQDVEERSSVDQPRKTTGISERELAELIQSGDREQIREAMPRMTPQMRRIAEAVIDGDRVAR